MEKNKTISKKVISLVLSLLMVFSCFSGMGLTAYAAPTCPNPGCRSTNVEPFLDTWECQDCGYIFNWSSGDDDPAEDGPLVGTVIKVGDTLTLDGDYIEYTPGNSDQATNSYKLESMEYDDPRGWWFIFEESGAFFVAGDETPEPDGFYVSGGNGTQSHPYTLALHYASAEPAPTVAVSPANSGTVAVVEDGDNWKFTATPASGYEFDCWKANDDGDFETVSDNNPYIIDKSSFTTMSNFTAVFKEAAEPVSYKAAAYDSATNTVTYTDANCEDYEVVTASTTTFEDGKWYVVNDNVTNNNRITVNDEAHLILCDGATLTANKGVTVADGSTLHIYAQSVGENVGCIVATVGEEYEAGIGGRYDDATDGGTIVINGGKVSATGGEYGGAGIGGSNGGAGGTVTIYGGIVTAQGGSHAAGIGGGEGRTGGTVTIYGGEIKATGGQMGGAGIGSASGVRNNGGTVTINGGTVTAVGGGFEDWTEAKGIGDGNGAEPSPEPSTQITIGNGLTVTAKDRPDNSVINITNGDPSGWGWVHIEKVAHTHDGITFTAWTSTNSLPTDGGNYYLTNDVLLENVWNVPNAEVNLCLDGHSITAAEGKEIQLMDVENGATLSLYDKEDNSGSISGAVSVNGAILVNSGTFNMYGGTIKDNMTTDHGAGVRVKNGGTFSLNGGSIENNKTKNQGGYGGGVHVETNSTFNMSGGSIKNNTAYSSGGVFIGTNCTFNMSGGSITGNIATNGYGGVLFTDDGTATFKLSGDVTISDNVTKIDIEEIDVHETHPSNMVIPDSVTIEVVDALTGEGKIYVQIGTSRVFTNSTGSVKAKDYIDKFVSDSRMYRIKPEGDELKIEAPYLRVGGTYVYDDNAADVFGDGKVKFTPANETTTYATLTLNGYQYDGTGDENSDGIIYLDSAQLRIVLRGENVVKATNPGIMINAPANTVISSDNGGSLEVVSEQGDAIYANGALTVESGTISATGANRGIAANGINLGGGKIVATGTGERGYGIYCEKLPWLPDNSVSINSGITSLIASGTLGAVYGDVANELEGLGWSDITGTDGQETIAVTTEARSLEYKKVAFVSHTHSFTYSASGATITATCSADDCPLENSKATLTIAAPDNLTYDKSAKAAVITDANGIQGTAKVQYQTKNGSTYGEATETAPTNAGTYKASITLGEGTNAKTASVEYTIAKADPTCTAPTGLTATYGQTLEDVTLTNPEGNTAGTWAWADSRTSVGNFGTHTFKASFVPTDTTNYNTKTNIDVSVTVAKKEVTVSGIKANNKVYDGSCNATIDTSSATISGVLSGDTLTVSADASFSDKNVAEDKTVYLSNITLGGESASNYTLASSGQQETTTASITAKAVTISGITANNKVYDGTTVATINCTSATIQGMVSGDDLSIYTDVASSHFADKNVGNNKTVTISYLLLTGSDAANYTVGSVTVTANITAKEVGLEWSNTELTYNGKAQKPTATATGLAGQDTCTVTVVGEQTNAGDNYTATAQSLSDSNYKLPENKTTAFKINKASQTAPAAPTEASKTVNSITLNTIPNGEYKCGAGDWQTSPTFTGLTQNTTYTFRQRYAADANHNASAGSEETVIRTANHAHSFTYSSSNATITATCNGAGTCNLTDNKVSFTLTAPTSLVYDGTDKKATLEGVEAFNAATGMNVSADDIVYNYKATSSDSAVVVTETKNAGIYQALYTLQTDPRPVAGITFTVAKADPTFTTTVTITPSDYKSGDTITKDGVTVATHIYTNPNGMTLMNGGTITSSVGNITNIEVTAQNSPFGEGWSNGTWTGDSSSVSFSNTVYYFTQIECTIEANSYPEDLTATYGDTLADVDLPDGWAWVDDTQSVGDAGTKTFKANFTPEDTDNYNVLENLDVTVTVDKAAINPTVTLEGWTYGETANEPSVSGNAGEGEVTYTYAVKGSDSFSDAVPTDAGEYTVKATIAATDNYKAGTATADFMVAKADIAPTVSIEGWTYGEEANKPVLEGNTGNGEVTYLYKEKGASDMSCIEEAPTQAGEYTVKVLIGETANYNSGSATADFTIAKAKVTITANDKSSKREADLKKLTYKVDGKILDSDDLGIKVTSNVKAAVAGKYDIKVAYTENANYDVTVVDGTYTVIDRITANERTKGKNKINSAIKATVNKNGSITAKWGAVANADKFEIYANYCSKDNEFKLIKTVKGDVHSFDITKLNGKKLDQKKPVKIYVVAYRKVNGKYEKITQSVQLHIVNQSKNYSNAKAITVKKDEFTLGVDKTAAIKPTLVLENSKKKAVEHVAKFRYQSTNTAVATVDKNGKIKAVGKGTCRIYIFANNGKLKSVKVTVK